MTLKIDGVWCKTKTEFEKLAKSRDYDLAVSYFDIFNRLIKSDPYGSEPSPIIVALYIRSVLGFKDFIEDLVQDRDISLDLTIINRCDYPKRGVLSRFDNVKFIDND